MTSFSELRSMRSIPRWRHLLGRLPVQAAVTGELGTVWDEVDRPENAGSLEDYFSIEVRRGALLTNHVCEMNGSSGPFG